MVLGQLVGGTLSCGGGDGGGDGGGGGGLLVGSLAPATWTEPTRSLLVRLCISSCLASLPSKLPSSLPCLAFQAALQPRKTCRAAFLQELNI